MINVMSSKPLRVSTEGTAGPYIMVTVGQLDEIRRVLDEHDVRYWVSELAISLNGGPETIIVDFGRAADAQGIQAILDGVS